MDQAYQTHQFAESAATHPSGLSNQDFQLFVIQEPAVCKASVGKEKDRKPVDPPPVVQLKVSTVSDPNQNYLQSSHFFLTCSLYGHNGSTALSGTLVSSLHRLKDLDNKEGAFFVFGDISVKAEGSYQLQFDLYEMQQSDECTHIGTTMSQPFPVVSAKNFHGMPESTGLTRTFSEQGVRLRLRKEPRSLLKPKGPSNDDYKPRHYRNNPRAIPSYGEMLPSPVSSDGSQFGQATLEANDLSNTAYQQPYKHLSRSYTTSNDQSHHGTLALDERSVKRSRTGSEQSHLGAYGLSPQSMDNSSYQSMATFSQGSMAGFTPLQYGGLSYMSPTMRSGFPSLRAAGQRSLSYSDASAHLSTDQSRYITQPQILPSQPSYANSMMHNRQLSDTNYMSADYSPRSFMPQQMPIVPTIPSDWRATTDSSFHSLSESSQSHRQIYGEYQNTDPESDLTSG